MMSYSERTTRRITSLAELRPGDHIQVPATDPTYSIMFSTNYGSSSTSGCDVPEKCNSKLTIHHLLVVKVIDETYIRVIHKVTSGGILEQNKFYLPKDITVLEYDCPYTGEAAIERAREKVREGFTIFTSNCEHFITEVRTGIKQGVAVDAGGRAIVGATAGAAIGAGIGLLIPVLGIMCGAGIGAVIGGVSGGAVMSADRQPLVSKARNKNDNVY